MKNKIEANTLKVNIVQYLEKCQLNMTTKQKKMKQFLLDHVTEIGYMSLKELSEQAGVSEVSVLNFCTLLGFENYIALREAFRDYVRSCMQNTFLRTLPEPDTLEHHQLLYDYCSGIVENHNEMIRNIDANRLNQTARILMNSRDIFVLGHDMSKSAADYLARRLNYLHIRAQSMNLGDIDSVQMLLSNLSEEDTVVLFSFPPYFVQAGDVAHYVRRCGGSLITITGSDDSPAILDGGINFLCKAPNAYFFNSMSVPLHLVEIIVYYIAILSGKKSEETISSIDGVGNHLIYNQTRGGEQTDD